MNERGLDIGNESITANRDLPWLQDVDGDGDGRSDVWLNSWDFEYRDVVIVDRDSTVIESFNLTRNDLAESDNFEILKSKFIESAATPPASPWQQSIEPLDVDSNGIITPLDALLVINELGKFPAGILPDLGGEAPLSYIDTDGDGFNGPLDALLVINQLTVINDGLAAAAPVAKRSVIGRAIFGGIGHDRNLIEVAFIQSLADLGHPAIHHVGGGDHIGAGFGMGQGCAGQQIEGGVVIDAVAFHDPAMSMICILAQAYIGNDYQFGKFFFDRFDCFLNNAVIRVGPGAQGIFFVGYAEKDNRRNSKFMGFLRGLQKIING